MTTRLGLELDAKRLVVNDLGGKVLGAKCIVTLLTTCKAGTSFFQRRYRLNSAQWCSS